MSMDITPPWNCPGRHVPGGKCQQAHEQIAALTARVAAAEKDAARYRWLQEWYFRDGQRKEIDPHGHIRQTTVEIIDAAIDAALSGADGVTASEKQP
jgi:hypothetical protein